MDVQRDLPIRSTRGPMAAPLLAAYALATLASSPSLAHPVYMEHVEHQVQLEVGPTNIDITVELRFNEVRSLSERRRMDGDRDGRISPQERDRYLRRLRRELADAFRLTCAGRPLDVVELYSPQLDLLGVDGVSPSHHVLRLFYFARTPERIAPPAALEFTDSSWASAPPLWLFTANAVEGIGLRTEPVPASAPAQSARPLRGRTTIVTIPPRVPASRPHEETPGPSDS